MIKTQALGSDTLILCKVSCLKSSVWSIILSKAIIAVLYKYHKHYLQYYLSVTNKAPVREHRRARYSAGRSLGKLVEEEKLALGFEVWVGDCQAESCRGGRRQGWRRRKGVTERETLSSANFPTLVAEQPPLHCYYTTVILPLQLQPGCCKHVTGWLFMLFLD